MQPFSGFVYISAVNQASPCVKRYWPWRLRVWSRGWYHLLL